MHASRSVRIRAKVLAEAPFGACDKSGARWPALRSKLDSEGEQNMTPSLSKKFASLVAVLVLVVLLRTATLAESTKVEGVIVGRSGSEIIVEYLQGAELAFLLDDSTKVSQTGG